MADRIISCKNIFIPINHKSTDIFKYGKMSAEDPKIIVGRLSQAEYLHVMVNDGEIRLIGLYLTKDETLKLIRALKDSVGYDGVIL